MNQEHVTAPRWIAEAVEASSTLVTPELIQATAKALLERLPIEELSGALDLPTKAEALSGVVAALSRDADVVTLTELYQGACRALDAAGVPYAEQQHTQWGVTEHPLDLAGRIRWLAEQRPTRIELQRVEDERDDFRSDAIHARAIAKVIGERDAKIKELEHTIKLDAVEIEALRKERNDLAAQLRSVRQQLSERGELAEELDVTEEQEQ